MFSLDFLVFVGFCVVFFFFSPWVFFRSLRNDNSKATVLKASSDRISILLLFPSCFLFLIYLVWMKYHKLILEPGSGGSELLYLYTSL